MDKSRYMTREEILKGLDCCSEFVCGECPYNVYESKEYPLRCIHMLIVDLKDNSMLKEMPGLNHEKEVIVGLEDDNT